jgi:hypothetical protein
MDPDTLPLDALPRQLARTRRSTHLPVSEAATANLLLHELDFLSRALGLPHPAAG